jgi:hypothetical protein
MSIKADVENILIQLNYPVNVSTIKQLEDIIANTPNFYDFAKHIFSLNDDLKKYDATVAMSNSNNYLKLKCDSKNNDEIKEFEKTINLWSTKYKVSLKQVENKNTYYILGKNS